ncbi:helicase HerA-like domain-containing protein [Taibaiella helva]|uniref:helicase HerA-like domain-containing protein n=1 Tax=Taibaiella helva TaxID=2301235 RepID=UPI000E57BAB8|nr:helicase HerA-like domain-containing protein [Taibaiella helva]
MANQEAFLAAIQNGYTFKGAHIKIGVAILDGVVIDGADVHLPLGMMNRHGLIAGATGTGKTKTLQVIAEALSDAGVPVLLMDIKGDLSGIAAAGVENDKIRERYQLLKETYQPAAYPVELLSLSQEKGARLRATVSEFGPVLLAKVLDLNDTQSGLLSMLFKYCDDKGLPLLDLKDLSRVLQYASDEGKADMEKDYGKISTTSAGTILRKVIELQQQGADQFFGELSFEVRDLIRTAPDGRGMVHVLRVTDMQDRPKLFSTFMLQMLAELYATLPEEGDMDKPKLVLFIDEAHLIFKEATKVLLSQIETIVKLIRSKGVGVFFCTQNPQDIPAAVLSQLGFKLQHALRAFTANDRKDIKQTAENYPESTFYKTEDLITQLGIGEALVTLLNEKGVPTPLAHTFLVSPRSRMDVLSTAEIDNLTRESKLIPKYNESTDRESAYEMLNRKMEASAAQEPAPVAPPAGTTARRTPAAKEEKSWLERAINSSAGKQVQRSVVRTLFGVIQKMFK